MAVTLSSGLFSSYLSTDEVGGEVAETGATKNHNKPKVLQPNAIYFGSGAARAARSRRKKTFELDRAACAAPLTRRLIT